MERLTSNKEVSDMSMIELAHNSCYADDKRNARYRDYDLDIDSRQLVRNLMKDMCGEDLSDLSDEEFDEYMGSVLSIELDSKIGLLALFYRNLWAMANLRETLKKYEDLEEQGKLIKLPAKDDATAHREQRATELRKIREKKRLKRKPTKKNKLAEICEIAKSKGMSYGQYMAEQYKKEVVIK